MTLEPWGNDQINRIFGDHRPVAGYVDVSWSAYSAYCYGSLLDNETSDAIFVPPR